LPVLARILDEAKLSSTPIGTVVLACAALKDVTVWFILAGIVALAAHSDDSALLALTLVGALLVGAVMPKEPGFVSETTAKLEPVTMTLLLPLYFARTGLRTSLGLIQGAEMWWYFGLIMLVAVMGMCGGTTMAARLAGMSWREAAIIGILLNTRGIMEIVILNIGRDIGVISSTVFAMMLLMALATTCMTMPLLRWWHLSRTQQPVIIAHEQPNLSQSL